MPELLGSALENGAEQECTSCEENSEAVGAEPLPSAEDCAKQLSSIFNSASITGDTSSSVERSNAEKANPTPSGTASTNEVQIGSGGDVFEVKISVEKCIDLCQQLQPPTPSDNRSVWLSYRFFGAVIQSEIFTVPGGAQQTKNKFTPMLNSFRVRTSLPELVEYFKKKKNGTLKIHLCTEGEVLGTAYVDVLPLFATEEKFEGTVIQNEYTIKPRGSEGSNPLQSSACPRIGVRLCVDRSPDDNKPRQLQPTKLAIHSSISSQTIHVASVDRASSPMRKRTSPDGARGDDDKVKPTVNPLGEREKRLIAREEEAAKKEKGVDDAAAALQRKQSEWEQWRHQQELAWHEKLRQKEAAMMRVVEERVCTIEKERLSSVEKLEARLRKALIEVEAKERQLSDIELGHQNERQRKLAELELKEKLMKQELKHSVELERAKVAAAVDQAVAAQKAAAESNRKVKQVEDQMDELRAQHRKTPEASLVHEVAGLKGQLADSERRIEAIKAEKNSVTIEKEQFRSNVHKLARALRHEREKAAKRQPNPEVRLSYDAQEKSFVLGGQQDEVTRILADLNRLSQSQHGSACQSPMASPMTRLSARSNIQDQHSGDAMAHGPPMPSPQPLCPTPIIRTHSPFIGTPAHQSNVQPG